MCFYYVAAAMIMFFLILHKTEHLGNATMKYLLAVQATGRNNAGEFSAEEKNNKTKLCLPLYVFKTPIHVEGST